METFTTRIPLLLAAFLMATGMVHAQNVGIGTTTPTGPLSFANTLGNKIVLWGDGNSAHYGIGVQSTVLQLYADQPNTSIAFGHGRSGAFTERVRITNGSADGMFINGRVHLRNGTSPLNVNFTPGVWLYKPDNSGPLGFMGAQNSQNIGFFGGPGGWGFTYDAINSRVGIGNNNPNAPLAFGADLGKKITLFPGASGDAGFGIAGNRLQIYSDNPNADVAIGYDVGGVFNERFAVKPNGALAVNGNTGSAGQILRSNGPGASASWATIGSQALTTAAMSPAFYVVPNNEKKTIPGATLNITLSSPAKVFIWIGLRTQFTCLTGAATNIFCDAYWQLFMLRNGAEVANYHIKTAAYTANPNIEKHDLTYGPLVFDLPGGIHNFTFQETLNSIASAFGITISANALIMPL